MQNIKLVIAYDGTHYLGWQKTRMGFSIEETLQQVLEQILQHPIHLQAASRTDAGVHAQGQVVNFLTAKEQLDLDRLQLSLNSLLPKDIAILSATQMPPPFHPTLDCMGKEYHYYMCYGRTQLPHHRFYSWHYPYELDLDKMRQAALHLIGRHDFTSFCNFKKNAHYNDYIRQIDRIEICPIESKRLIICIQGNHFLYKMVRNIAGLLAEIGRGKRKEEEIPLLLNCQDRTQGAVTAPAHGLFLQRVLYDKKSETVLDVLPIQ